MKFSSSPLLAFAAAALLPGQVLAAGATSGGVPNLSSAAASESLEEATQTNTGTGSASGSGNKASNTGSATGSNSGSTAAPSAAPTGVSIQLSSVTITGGSSVSATGTIPTITGGSSATTGGALPTDLPTISGEFRIVAPSVPPTSNAPFMQVSNLPEGTVFIAVGAILGFLAVSVLLWRGLVAWSLHRSVKRAAAAQYAPDTKTHFRTPPAPFYKYSDRDSTISLSALGAKNNRKGGRPPTSHLTASQSSLFFSPTAGAAGAGGLANSGNRGSNYLPAGYYAAGASQPGNGQGMTHIGQGQGASISLSNLGPARDGYARARSMGTTPPDSPAFRPQSSGMHGHAYGASSSTLNLREGEVRAPSVFLDDLFDGENAPPVPGHGRQ